ncbi:aldose-1-epimerase [Ornithinimicrobium sp. Y1847]|uniref:aldose-1-epimerase n=1 Tax=unclassified Ornithinimicrobium TaxID=2615080 RepID=UPI003B67B023
MSANGTITRLRSGDYEATIASVGATLVALTFRGRDLIVPFDPDGRSDGYQGAVLVPWPNRITQARYAVGGVSLQLPVNEAETGAALHGFGYAQDWQPEYIDDAEACWVLDLTPSEGYPFPVRCRVEYVLDARHGLQIHVVGTNVGPVDAPFGASAHPYLTCGLRPVDEYTITVPASAYLGADERMVPTELSAVDGTELDLRHPQVIGGRPVDHAYTGLPDAEWEVTLTHPHAGGVRLTSAAPWVQVYTGERLGRVGVAVEPMTCGPDAFNRQPEEVLLRPGESRSVEMKISAL